MREIGWSRMTRDYKLNDKPSQTNFLSDLVDPFHVVWGYVGSFVMGY